LGALVSLLDQYRKSNLGEPHRIGVCAEVLAKPSFMHRRENVFQVALKPWPTELTEQTGKAWRFPEQRQQQTKANNQGNGG
jgi:hypothetical protein